MKLILFEAEAEEGEGDEVVVVQEWNSRESLIAASIASEPVVVPSSMLVSFPADSFVGEWMDVRR